MNMDPIRHLQIGIRVLFTVIILKYLVIDVPSNFIKWKFQGCTLSHYQAH